MKPAPRCEVILTCHPQKRGQQFDSLEGVRCKERAERRGDGYARCWVHECAFRAGRPLAYAIHGGELTKILEALPT